MGFDTNGNWTSDFYPTQDRDADIPILASKFETLIQTNIKGSFDNCILRDGTGKPIADISFNSQKITNLADGEAAADAVNKGQLDAVVDDIPNASESTAGKIQIATEAEAKGGINDTKAITPLKLAQTIGSSSVLPQGYLFSLIPTYVDTDEVSIGIGRCRDEANTRNMQNDISAFSKTMSGWNAGSGNGGLPSGVSATSATKYYLFIIGGGLTPATFGIFTTPDISANVTAFSSVTNGFMGVQVDNGALQTLTNLDFSLCTTLADIATIINNRLSNATCEASGNNLLFTSNSTGANSSFEIIDISSTITTGTDLYPAAYLHVSSGTNVQGEDEQADAIDFAFDTDVDATNILADSNISEAGYTKYRRIGQFWTNASSEILQYSILSYFLNPELEDLWEDDAVIPRGSYTESFRWYKVYKNGNIEQGGRGVADQGTVTFPKPFNQILGIWGQGYGAGGKTDTVFTAQNLTNTTFSPMGRNTGGSTDMFDFFWEAKGR